MDCHYDFVPVITAYPSLRMIHLILAIFFCYLFLFLNFQCLYCSLGATLVDDSRRRFDEFIKRTAGMPMFEDTKEKPAAAYQLPTSKPTLYDYMFDKEQMVWVAWDWLVPNYEHDRNLSIYEILVPTVDTLRTEWILKLSNDVS